MLAIIKKELKNYFFSPIGYIVIGIFLLVFSAFFFYTSVVYAYVNLTNLFYCVGRYGLMFIVPLLTMWSISGERKNGTEQLIITSPISMVKFVMGKFIASMVFIIIPALCSFIYFGLLCNYKVPDIPTFLTTLFGFILLSTAYLSFGIFASSLTESPIISAIISFGSIFFVTWIPQFVSGLSSISFMNMFQKFFYGQIDLCAVVMFLTTAILGITLTIIIMQRRKMVK